MINPLQALAQGATLRPSAELALFKVGQVLEAVVIGRLPDGTTALKIGDAVIAAQLPQQLPAGTTLQLQVKVAGPAPQLTLVGTPQQPATATPAPQMPLPPIVQSVPLQVGAPIAAPQHQAVVPMPSAPAAQPTVQPQAAPATPGSISTSTSTSPTPGSARTLPTIQSVAQASPAGPPQPASLSVQPTSTALTASSATPALFPQAPTSAPQTTTVTPAPAIAQAPAPTTTPPATAAAVRESPQTLAPVSAPIASAPSAPTSTPPASQSVTVPVASASTPAAPSAQPAAQPVTTSSTPAPTGVQSAVVQTSPPPQTAPTPSAPSVSPPSINLSAQPTATLAPPALQPTVSPLGPPQSAPPASVLVAAPQGATTITDSPTPPSSIVAPPPTVSVGASPASVPIASPPAAPQATAATSTAVTPPPATTPEPASPSPLLVAQSSPRPEPSAAVFARTLPLPTPPTVTPVPTAPPATPAAALAQMVPEALAKQNTIAPLLASLAAVVAKPGALPEPVLRAALQVLGQRVQIPSKGPTADMLQTAIEKSGVFLEAGLAKTATPAPDMKSALISLRSTLATWFGGNPPPVHAAQQAAPPLRGMPPRAELPDLAPPPDAGRETARTLHHQADAALSRVKLMQLASLPDTDSARPSQPELRMEVPFLIGSETVLAQFQVFRDGSRKRTDGKRGWTMRFAMNFTATGEVGAEIGLLGKNVSVALWAAERDTHDRLEAALPELAPALAALGLDPGAIRLRPAPPEPEVPPSGHYLDSLT